jgi:hypothetical protein
MAAEPVRSRADAELSGAAALSHRREVPLYPALVEMAAYSGAVMTAGGAGGGAADVVPAKTLGEDIARRAIKIVDIGYVTVIYFFFAFALGVSLDRAIGKFDEAEADRKTTGRLAAECIAHIYLCGVVVYFTRNVVERVPFPLDGVAGFVHGKVKELTNAAVFTFVFMYYQKNLRDKLIYLGGRW